MRFDLIDLRLFVHVHAAGTITGGATQSHMTLASASERIRAMEDSLGTPLLLRAPRGVQPTPAGRSLLQHARQVLLQIDRLQADLGAYGAGLQGQVRVLCNTSALSEHLPQALSRFLAGLVVHPFRADPLVLVVPRGHAWAGRAGVGLAEVAGAPLVGMAEHSAIHAHLAQHARRLGKRLVYRVRLRSFESVCRLVGEGIGVGIVPLAVAQRCARSAGVQRVALTDAFAARALVVALRDEAALAPAARLFVQHLLDQPSPGKTTD